MEIRNRVGRVGCITSRSSLESNAGERPVCLLNSRSPMLLRSRSRRNFAPMAYLLSPSAMVFDSFIEFVFLAWLLMAGFFLSRKRSLSGFFTVKHNFLMIKVYPGRQTGTERKTI